MKVLLLSLLALANLGCGMGFHRHLLGTRVHRFQAGGIQFVHCSILMDRSEPQLAHDAIAVCRDEVEAPPHK